MNQHPCGFDVATRPGTHRGGDRPGAGPLGRKTDRPGGCASSLPPLPGDL